MNTELVNLLNAVRDWLKFAEAKNAALVAFAGILLPFTSSLRDFGILAHYYSTSAVIFLFLAIFFSLVSFVPHMNPSRRIGRFFDGKQTATNLLFFGDIARVSLKEFETMASEVFELIPEAQIDSKAIEQIHVISGLTMRKLQFFNIALTSLILGIFTPAAIMVLLILRKNEDV